MDKATRKRIEEGILAFVTPITPGGGNAKVYKNIFDNSTDDQFEKLWVSIKEGGYIPIFLDNYDTAEMVHFDTLVKLAEKWDIPVEQHVIIPDQDTGIVYQTPEKAVVGIVECCKQRQLSIKKIGVSKHDYQIEDLTGQPTGDSKAGGISNPEINILIALGLPTMAKELASVKGGDIGAYRHYKTELSTTGATTTDGSLRNGTGVKSLKTVQWLLLGRHIQSNISARV